MGSKGYAFFRVALAAVNGISQLAATVREPESSVKIATRTTLG